MSNREAQASWAQAQAARPSSEAGGAKKKGPTKEKLKALALALVLVCYIANLHRETWLEAAHWLHTQASKHKTEYTRDM